MPGIFDFCTGRNCMPSSIGEDTVAEYSEMKEHLDNGELLHIALVDFPSEGVNHSVVAFGYSGNYLSLSTGWDTNYHCYAYSCLTIGQYVYVGY